MYRLLKGLKGLGAVLGIKFAIEFTKSIKKVKSVCPR